MIRMIRVKMNPPKIKPNAMRTNEQIKILIEPKRSRRALKIDAVISPYY